jgi:hypothetical protein
MSTVCVHLDVMVIAYSTSEAVVKVVAGYQNVAGSIVTVSINITIKVIKMSL